MTDPWNISQTLSSKTLWTFSSIQIVEMIWCTIFSQRLTIYKSQFCHNVWTCSLGRCTCMTTYDSQKTCPNLRLSEKTFSSLTMENCKCLTQQMHLGRTTKMTCNRSHGEITDRYGLDTNKTITLYNNNAIEPHLTITPQLCGQEQFSLFPVFSFKHTSQWDREYSPQGWPCVSFTSIHLHVAPQICTLCRFHHWTEFTNRGHHNCFTFDDHVMNQPGITTTLACVLDSPAAEIPVTGKQ